MEIKYNVSGDQRKRLVQAVSEITNETAVYQMAPTFAYQVGAYTIDRDGTISFDDTLPGTLIRSLITMLADRGFVAENAPAPGPPADDGGNNLLTIYLPAEGITDLVMDNLRKLVDSKAELIKAAIDADELPIQRTGGHVGFPWFSPMASQEEQAAYHQLVTALLNAAQTQQRVTAKEKPVENQKYAMRCFLVRLGFVGQEYAVARKILLKNLPGNSAFKDGKRE